MTEPGTHPTGLPYRTCLAGWGHTHDDPQEDHAVANGNGKHWPVTLHFALKHDDEHGEPTGPPTGHYMVASFDSQEDLDAWNAEELADHAT